jgi:hypothetical protein
MNPRAILVAASVGINDLFVLFGFLLGLRR